MGKHAYCIIAHQDPVMFSLLISAIDDVRNDIYVLIDAKSEITAFKDAVEANLSSVFFLPQHNINWGAYSLVQAELNLFEAVVESGVEYDYVHLLSGVDYPIKSQDYIHEFFGLNNGKEFVGIKTDEKTNYDVWQRVSFYYLFSEHFKRGNRLIYIIRDISLRFQYKLCFRRNKSICFFKGCQWASITYSFCKYLIGRKKNIKKIFHHTMCPDELFLQTVLMNSPFKDNVYNIQDEYDSCKREIDWERGNPYVWKEEDLPRLLTSDALFARKFSLSSLTLIESLRDKFR